MKRILILALLAAFVCSLAGCTSTTSSSSDSTTAATTTTTSAATTAAISGTPLTAAQLADIDTFLTDADSTDNNGFILTTYGRVQDIDLYEALYELKAGAGGTFLDLSTPSAELSTVEAAVGSLDNIADEPTKVIKYPRAQLDAFLIRKIGIPSADAMANTTMASATAPLGLLYLEAYDAYYLVGCFSNNWIRVEAQNGVITADGLWVVSFPRNTDTYTVTLKPTADGYQFVSNVKN
ncbi:MAG: hypothetical protein FWF49_01215 [Oscillospiraceae bacterium]|nr:hypothetical protein [Oscillospiraceae bacterium]